MAAIYDAAAANSVVHQGRDVRLCRIDRVVGLEVAYVGIEVPLLLGAKLPLRLVAGIGGWIDPASLLKADGSISRLGQRLRRDCSGWPSSDHQHVGGFRVSATHFGWTLPCAPYCLD